MVAAAIIVVVMVVVVWRSAGANGRRVVQQAVGERRGLLVCRGRRGQVVWVGGGAVLCLRIGWLGRLGIGLRARRQRRRCVESRVDGGVVCGLRVSSAPLAIDGR